MWPEVGVWKLECFGNGAIEVQEFLDITRRFAVGFTVGRGHRLTCWINGVVVTENIRRLGTELISFSMHWRTPYCSMRLLHPCPPSTVLHLWKTGQYHDVPEFPVKLIARRRCGTFHSLPQAQHHSTQSLHQAKINISTSSFYFPFKGQSLSPDQYPSRRHL